MAEDKIVIEIEGIEIDIRDTASVRKAVELMELKLKREREEHSADNKLFGGLAALSSILLLISSLKNQRLRRKNQKLTQVHLKLCKEYLMLMIDYGAVLEKLVKKG